MSRARVNVRAIAARCTHVFDLPLVTCNADYPTEPRMRAQWDAAKRSYVRESDGWPTACLSLHHDAAGYRLDYHRAGESGVSEHPLGSASRTARELAEALWAAEAALEFVARRDRQ